MNVHTVTKYASDHPVQAIMVGAIVVIGVLWLFGAFTAKPAASSEGAGSANMAAAYYAAEAQQAVVGGQIQMATIGAARDTAIAGLTADAAVKTTHIQANAATTINQQNADATTTLGGQALNATLSNNATAWSISANNNATAMQINDTNNMSSRLSDYFHTVLPQEFAAFAGRGLSTFIPGIGNLELWGGGSPNEAAAAGFTPAQIATKFGS
jgi:hypothetical protein